MVNEEIKCEWGIGEMVLWESTQVGFIVVGLEFGMLIPEAEIPHSLFNFHSSTFAW